MSFQGHNAIVNCVVVMMDSRRIISADRDGLLCVWLADSSTLLQTIQGPYKSLAVTNNMKFAVSLWFSIKILRLVDSVPFLGLLIGKEWLSCCGAGIVVNKVVDLITRNDNIGFMHHNKLEIIIIIIIITNYEQIENTQCGNHLMYFERGRRWLCDAAHFHAKHRWWNNTTFIRGLFISNFPAQSFRREF